MILYVNQDLWQWKHLCISKESVDSLFSRLCPALFLLLCSRPPPRSHCSNLRSLTIRSQSRSPAETLACMKVALWPCLWWSRPTCYNMTSWSQMRTSRCRFLDVRCKHAMLARCIKHWLHIVWLHWQFQQRFVVQSSLELSTGHGCAIAMSLYWHHDSQVNDAKAAHEGAVEAWDIRDSGEGFKSVRCRNRYLN